MANLLLFFPITVARGRRKDDPRTVGHQECGQTGPETASGREGRRIDAKQHRTMFGRYAGHRCVQVDASVSVRKLPCSSSFHPWLQQLVYFLQFQIKKNPIEKQKLCGKVFHLEMSRLYMPTEACEMCKVTMRAHSVVSFQRSSPGTPSPTHQTAISTRTYTAATPPNSVCVVYYLLGRSSFECQLAFC